MRYSFFIILFFFLFSIKSQGLDYVFKSGEEGYNCYRIPTIIKSQNGALLAFAEGRKNSCSDTGDIDLVLKKSLDIMVKLGQLWRLYGMMEITRVAIHHLY